MRCLVILFWVLLLYAMVLMEIKGKERLKELEPQEVPNPQEPQQLQEAEEIVEEPSIRAIFGNATEIILRDKELQGLLKNATKADFLLVNFYLNNCDFSADLQPLYSQLPSIFPDLYVASVESSQFSTLFYKYGIFGFPKVGVFKGKEFVPFTGSRNLQSLVKFVHNQTDLPLSFIPDYSLPSSQSQIQKAPPHKVLQDPWFYCAVLALFGVYAMNKFGQPQAVVHEHQD